MSNRRRRNRSHRRGKKGQGVRCPGPGRGADPGSAWTCGLPGGRWPKHGQGLGRGAGAEGTTAGRLQLPRGRPVSPRPACAVLFRSGGGLQPPSQGGTPPPRCLRWCRTSSQPPPGRPLDDGGLDGRQLLWRPVGWPPGVPGATAVGRRRRDRRLRAAERPFMTPDRLSSPSTGLWVAPGIARLDARQARAAGREDPRWPTRADAEAGAHLRAGAFPQRPACCSWRPRRGRGRWMGGRRRVLGLYQGRGARRKATSTRP